MKRYIAVILILFAVVLVSGASLAFADSEGEGQGDVHFAVGTKLWLNTWTKWMFGGNTLLMSSSDTEIAVIPTVSLKAGNFFVAGGYMTETAYTFPDNKSPSTNAGTWYWGFKGWRSEIDLNAGYYVHPSLGLTIGYKQINQRYDYGTARNVFNGRNTAEFKFYGPTIGLVGGVPLGRGFSLYGNAAFGSMTLERYAPGQRTVTDDSIYTSSELGFAYAPNQRISLSFGYKTQIVETDLQDSTVKNAADTTKGFIFGANIIF